MSKSIQFNIRLDDEEKARLIAVAAHYGCPAATAMRMLIKHAFDSIEYRTNRKPVRK